MTLIALAFLPAVVAAAVFAVVAARAPADRRLLPIAGIAAGALVVVVLVSVASIFDFFVIALGCDGDGGVPYAAHASARGRLCTSLDESPGLLWVLGLPVLAAVACAARAVYERRPRWLGIALAVGIGTVAALFGAVSLLPSRCPDEAANPGSAACAHY